MVVLPLYLITGDVAKEAVLLVKPWGIPRHARLNNVLYLYIAIDRTLSFRVGLILGLKERLLEDQLYF